MHSLRVHGKAVHEQRRDYKCDECDATFTANASLKKRVATVHEKKKDHKCAQCDYASVRSGGLRS